MPPSPAANTCWLYLVRHGATTNNQARPPILQGQNLDAPLCDEGLQQAQRTAEMLAGYQLEAVYSSPLLRARQTAEAIAGASGLEVVTIEALTEVDVGRWEGMAWDAIERESSAAYHAFMSDPAANPYLGGESLQSVQRRARPALDRLGAENLGRTIAVVAHNVVNRAYLAHLMDISLGKYRGIPQSNCGVNLIRYRPNGAKLLTINAVAHLDGLH